MLVGGQDVTGWSLPQRARIGLGRSFQITSTVPSFTALENATLAAQDRRPRCTTRKGGRPVDQPRRFLRPGVATAATRGQASPRWTLDGVWALFPRPRERRRNLGSRLSGGGAANAGDRAGAGDQSDVLDP